MRTSGRSQKRSSHRSPVRASRTPVRSDARSAAVVARPSRTKLRLKIRSGLRLKIRSGTSVSAGRGASQKPVVVHIRSTATLRKIDKTAANSIHLAAGTEKPAKTLTTTKAHKPLKAVASTKTVHNVEVRPSGTVVSRQPLANRKAVQHVPHHPIVSHKPPSWMLEECHVASARAGDQNEILQLLSGLPTPPSKAEFHAAVDHPDHDSANRLVARLAGRIVGHVEVVPRSVMLYGTPVPAAVIDRLAVLPECRGAGHGQRLIGAAEDRMRRIGAAIGFSRTRIAPSFYELGWSVLGRDCVTPGRPADILSRLLDAPQRVGERVSMRQWRHVELPAILRIYKQNASRFVGPLERSEVYSRWLVSRSAFDSIIVALMGQDRYDLHETTAKIVGYAIQSGNRVLELMADPEIPGLERDILARVCAEAIENDRQEIIYESGANDSLHDVVAGGESTVQGSDRMIVAKVYRPLEVLTAIAEELAVRMAQRGIRETVELGLDAPSFRGSIIVANGKSTVHAGRVGRSYLRLVDDELARLLLGQCDPIEAAEAGRLEPSTQMALKLASQLFPRTPLWCPMWDDLPA
ncbi:MAG: GNAT family N-acetyltransferase [Planctomycetota bacterium]|nr:MAG: GNAT family N-acetyltransferase [Planctomycetota bacterium]